MENTNSKLETKRIILYLVITFAITCIYCFGVIYPLSNTDNLRQEVAILIQLLVAVVMFMPAVGVLLTRLITKIKTTGILGTKYLLNK